MNCVNADFNTNYLLGLAYGNLGKNMQAMLAFKQAEIIKCAIQPWSSLPICGGP